MAHHKPQGPEGAAKPTQEQRTRAANWTRSRPNARARMRRVSPELAALHEADADAVMAYDCAVEMDRLNAPAKPTPGPPILAPALTFLIMGTVLAFLLSGWFFLAGVVLALLCVPWTKPLTRTHRPHH
jgi:hypothetical protein